MFEPVNLAYLIKYIVKLLKIPNLELSLSEIGPGMQMVFDWLHTCCISSDILQSPSQQGEKYHPQVSNVKLM